MTAEAAEAPRKGSALEALEKVSDPPSKLDFSYYLIPISWFYRTSRMRSQQQKKRRASLVFLVQQSRSGLKRRIGQARNVGFQTMAIMTRI